MAYAFDTLIYARRLRDAGVESAQAEAHAEVARDLIMSELVTKQDLDVTRQLLETRVETLELRLVIRFGAMLVAAVAVLAAVIKF